MGETLRLLRPDDLVILEVELVGLVVAGTPSGPTIAAQQGKLERRLIFRLPPQHIAERAYYDASLTGCDKPEKIKKSESPDAPGFAVSRIAAPSRIVFAVPEALLPLALSFDALLAWHRFELVVPPACRAADQELAPIAEPAAGETALELPWRLLLAPEQGSGWQTTASAAVRAGRTELWRAALGHIRDGAFEPASQTSTVPIRAVWSPDWRPPQQPWLTDLDRDIPFRTSLRPSDRHELVVLTSGFQGYAESEFNLDDSEFKAIPVGPGEIALERPLQRLLRGLVDRPTPYRPLPAQASRLWVSSLGASLRSAGSWKAAESLPEDRLGRARAVLEDAVAKLGVAGAQLVARDVGAADERERDNLLAEAVKLHEGRILAQAALQPEAVAAVAQAAAGGEPTTLSHWSHDAVFGRDQKVVVVHEGALFPFGHRAALVRVTERRIERTVAAGGMPVANLYQYTYIVVRQRTRTLTLTAPQARAFPFGVELEVLTTVTPHLSPPEGDAIAGAPSAFWIRVASGGGSSRLPFSCAGRDASGERFTFSTPLVFVPLSLWTDQAASATVASAYTKAAPAANVARQRVALAPSPLPREHRDDARRRRHDADGAGPRRRSRHMGAGRCRRERRGSRHRQDLRPAERRSHDELRRRVRRVRPRGARGVGDGRSAAGRAQRARAVGGRVGRRRRSRVLAERALARARADGRVRRRRRLRREHVFSRHGDAVRGREAQAARRGR